MRATIGEALKEAWHRLEAAGIAEARATAEVLLADLLLMARPLLYVEARQLLSVQQCQRYATRLERRLHGEPLQYITGRQEFWSLEFAVNPYVLIPRPESELLVEQGVRLAQQWGCARPQAPLCLLDVGTGSGNLAISLAHTLPQSQVWGIDRALGALRVAQWNAQRLQVAERLTWVCGDLVTPLQGRKRDFALCVGNLPYVTTVEWQQLPREIKGYEPPEALRGGDDGLSLIRRLIATSPAVLAPGGSLLLEVGWRQAAAVAECIRAGGQFQDVGVYQDMAGIDRVVWARMP
jgi:release factor glutamine methyltransferase